MSSSPSPDPSALTKNDPIVLVKSDPHQEHDVARAKYHPRRRRAGFGLVSSTPEACKALRRAEKLLARSKSALSNPLARAKSGQAVLRRPQRTATPSMSATTWWVIFGEQTRANSRKSRSRTPVKSTGGRQDACSRSFVCIGKRASPVASRTRVTSVALRAVLCFCRLRRFGLSDTPNQFLALARSARSVHGDASGGGESRPSSE